MSIISKLTMGGLIVGLVTANTGRVQAGDDEWATVGKVLTGVAIGAAIHQGVHHGGHVSVSINTHRPRRIVRPAPVIVHQPPVVVLPRRGPHPAPVIIPRPVHPRRPVVIGPVVGACPQPVYVSRPGRHFHRDRHYDGPRGRGRGHGHGHGHEYENGRWHRR